MTEFLTLNIGTHNYFGDVIDTVPIRTTSGLCYKVKPLKFEFDTALLFQIIAFPKGNLVNQINLYIATDSTWQGVIYGEWPRHAKSPLKIVGEISPKSLNQYISLLEITEWNYMEGIINYSECLLDYETISTGCISMFHPNAYEFDDK